jgi:hypothetical protein
MKTHEIVSYFHKEFPAHLSWAHACNTKSKISAALESNTDFLEVDIRMNEKTGKPGLAHNQTDTFELSIEQLLQILANRHKGLKLDFKELAAVEPTLRLVAEHISTLGPLIINADVLPGPGAHKRGLPFNEVCHLAKNLLPSGLLSVGWVTQVIANSRYTEAHVQEMLDVLLQTGWQGDVTFPVRAHYVPSSWNTLEKILKKPGYTLTIWNNEPVPSDLLQWITNNVPPEKAFVDVYDVETGFAIGIF